MRLNRGWKVMLRLVKAGSIWQNKLRICMPAKPRFRQRSLRGRRVQQIINPRRWSYLTPDQNRPSSLAIKAACVRLAAPILRYNVFTCNLIVGSCKSKSRAISLFDLPFDKPSRTCNSRLESFWHDFHVLMLYILPRGHRLCWHHLIC